MPFKQVFKTNIFKFKAFCRWKKLFSLESWEKELHPSEELYLIKKLNLFKKYNCSSDGCIFFPDRLRPQGKIIASVGRRL